MPRAASWRDKEFSIGQLAARSGTAVTALRFYEAEGLITSTRNGGNQRRYPRDALRRIALIRVGQRVGIPLATIREALAYLPEDRVPNRKDWALLADSWRAELDERITALQQLRDQFTDCVGCGCLSIDRCAMANPRDELGRHGTGPQRLRQGPTAAPASATGR
ncbi:redox-sensitive transcriptional activator SoxR [Streptomyces iconiensis]|uniref:Redox-sensitive transcriptional activator SoxR n=1 Tax=Streptomyces iconiensis TaxID=1384038 RepID=A0ABT7A6K6_9ACTN|nr:redox-sensitive transcriptional activator SoxR [Streptomyces iconiensis]MDJ1136960.1 redox-sensitive transcriptional activator SoxR [Streptomyces iconiensis]